ncbi:MAG: nicotinate (nicotinamide) nucleotide adenylyltransferase [Candidatus Protochlamydia sp.]|nr:nicotinate (nicotinamide) nucleotide adenylyltransferase [Candidatus Protochlamydia sp.]
MKKQKIGLLGGSFDPVHFGHINLAIELMEKAQLDEVWFVPAQLNPHKAGTLPVPINHRFAMVNEAIMEIPQFSCHKVEAERAPPSYTIETLRILMEEENKKEDPANFLLLLGQDSIHQFSNWREADGIVQRVPLLIGSRFGAEPAMPETHQCIQEAIQKGTLATKLLDISATEVRLRLSKGLYCGHLVPATVLRYIKEHFLYSVQ